jgi:cardiolipin synthase C
MRLISLFLFFFLLPAAQANQVKYLPKAPQALAEYIHTIREAKNSLDLTYYIWDPCSEVGRLIIREITRKQASRKKQGLPPLPVRLLIDSYHHEARYRPAMQAAMANRGVAMKFYNAAGTMDPRRNIRTHIKFLAADDKVITGGRNISDDYFGLTPGQNWIDREALLQGSGAQAAHESMDELWEDRLSFSESKPASAAEIKEHEEKCLAPNARVLQMEKYLNANLAKLRAQNQAVSCPQAEFIADHPDFLSVFRESASAGDNNHAHDQAENLRQKHLSWELLGRLRKAKSAIIENYSLIPPGEIAIEFERLGRSGRPAKIITNLAAEEDERLMVPALLHYQTNARRGGINLVRVPNSRIVNDSWAMTPGNPTYKIHSKVFVFNNSDTMVTAFNIDPRSFHTNLESGISAPNCPAFAKKVLGTMEDTYGRIEKILRLPEAQPCLDGLGKQPDQFEKFISWALFNLL